MRKQCAQNFDFYALLNFNYLFNYLQDEIDTRPRVSTFISSLVNYSNTIPAATDPDAKPPAPAARMGKYSYTLYIHFYMQ